MKLKKIFLLVLITVIFAGSVFVIFFKDGIILDSLNIHIESPFTQSVIVPNDFVNNDRNNNGIPDPFDIVTTARKEVIQRTKYESNYYANGYPPDDEGVCTDVIWRGLFGADINLKELMDIDIRENTNLYPRVQGKPDPNIDFRRVPNQYVFFERFSQVLTTEVIAGDIENLRQWQPGDIVLFLDGFHHVAIISDRRAKDGTPYIIHNNPPFATEIKLKSINTPIAGHYRWNY
jgi:uncharacterized protein